jgi:signal transduction histidine kinase
MIFDAVALVISCFVSGNKIYMLGSGLLVVTMMVVVSIAIASVRKGNRAGSLYLFSWFALLPSISIALVTDLGLFDFQFNDDLVLKVAHAAEALLMSSALAFRIRMLRSEKLESDKQVLRSEAKSEAKSRYFEEMSLELRAPVDGVIGMADLLSGTNLDEHQRQYVNAIHRSSQGLINIVDDISDVSEIDTGKLEIETNDFQLDILLNDVGIMLAPLTNKRHLELITSIKPNTPMMLTGDPVRLQQVITDLISSVAQVIEEGQVIVRASQFSATDVYSEIRLKSVIPVLVLMKIFNTSCLNPSNQMGTAHPAGLLESGSV